MKVLVTGLGAVTPFGVGVEALMDGSFSGRSALGSGRGTCHLSVEAQLGKRSARRTDRFAQLALVAAEEAVEQSGFEGTVPAERVACLVGTAVGGLQTLESQIETHRAEGPAAVSPLTVPLLMANAAAAQIAMRFGFHGETAAVVSACAAGAQAIVDGARLIASGEADVAVVGGAEAANTDFTSAIFTSAGALSPTGRSRPFHSERDGFVLAEGAGILVLESEESARKRDARVLGELSGWGTSTDAHHITAPEPSGRHAAQALSLALTRAGVSAGELGYVNAHGTGTNMNDAVEAVVLREVLGAEVASVPVSSTKSAIGHLLGAAGAVEAIVSLGALLARHLPPTVGLDDIDPAVQDLCHVLAAGPMPEGSTAVASNSMGFGGHNVALVFSAGGRADHGAEHL